MTQERAVLAGGCFWGAQDLIRKQAGVLSTRVGYTGGTNSHATYRNHPGHAEAVEIIFDPARISYRQLLEFFFQIHDPSTRNRQGNDVGSSYRSAIFYTSEEQKQIAQDTIADVDASGLWPGSRYRSRSCRRFLGSRAGAPGLSPTDSKWLHLPFRAAALEIAEAHGYQRGAGPLGFSKELRGQVEKLQDATGTHLAHRLAALRLHRDVAGALSWSARNGK